MITPYYFWKWADNDLPGRPGEVWPMLLRGQMHPTLQTFDARPLIKQLEGSARRGRALGEEWSWQVEPRTSSGQARFVFVTCPPFNRDGRSVESLLQTIFPLDVSGYDEERGTLIPGLLPKLMGCNPCSRMIRSES